MDNGLIKPIKEINTFHELLETQKKVWGLEDIDVVPTHLLKVVSDEMGPKAVILGYFLDDEIIGFTLTLPTSNPQEVIMHMLAVATDFQRKNVGYNLMLKLRELMLSQNIDKIFWTFDPLESVNANLYIRKLGGIITRHSVDYYGPIESRMHSGFPTDRFIVEWNIRNKHVENRIKDSGKGNCSSSQLNCPCDDSEVQFVEIPLNIQELKKEDISGAIKIRMETRSKFEEIIEKSNYVGLDFIYDKINRKGSYIFKKPLSKL